jgi:hypothetical protein
MMMKGKREKKRLFLLYDLETEEEPVVFMVD